jgi:hypothetical protein
MYGDEFTVIVPPEGLLYSGRFHHNMPREATYNVSDRHFCSGNTALSQCVRK